MNQANRNVLDDPNVGRLLFKLSLPGLFGMLTMTLYNVVDTIFVGHYVGPLGIAGLAIVFPIQMFSVGIGQMTGMGGASQISRLLGMRDHKRAEMVLGNAVGLTVLLALLIMIGGLIDTSFLLRLIGSSETILPYARDYAVIIIAGMVFATLGMAMASLISAEGQAMVTMRGMMIGAVGNIILDAIFIITLNMGIQGAALASVLTQLFSMLYFLFYYIKGGSLLKIRMENFRLRHSIVLAIFSIGIASLARTLAGSISAIFVNRMIISFGGDSALSAFGILNRIMMFVIIPGIVIGQGLQPVLGFNYGAKRYGLALRAIKIALLAAFICSTVVFLLLYFLPEPLIRVFTSDESLTVQAAYAARHVFIAISVIGVIMVGSTIFQALGKARQAFTTAISRSVLLVPLVILLPRIMDLDGVWWAFPITDVLVLMLTLSLLIPQLRKLRRQQQSVLPETRTEN